MKYFVLFKAECHDMPINDVVDLIEEVNCIEDIKVIEKQLSDEWFGDGRDVTLLNISKL